MDINYSTLLFAVAAVIALQAVDHAAFGSDYSSGLPEAKSSTAQGRDSRKFQNMSGRYAIERIRKRIAATALVKANSDRSDILRRILAESRKDLGDRHPMVAVCLYELAANYCPVGMMLTPKTDERWHNVNMNVSDFNKRTAEAIAEFESRKREANGWIAEADAVSALTSNTGDSCAIADEFYELNKLQPLFRFENCARKRYEAVAADIKSQVIAQRHALIRLAELASNAAARLASFKGNLDGLQKAKSFLVRENALRKENTSDALSNSADELGAFIDIKIESLKKILSRN